MNELYNINPSILKKLEELVNERSEKKEVERAWKVYNEEFLRKFPFRDHPEEIDKLTPEDLYNPGKRNYFFYYIEHKLRALGHIRIGSAITWEMAINNIDKFKRLLKIAVSSKPLYEKVDADWESIPYWGGDKIVAKKIIFLYDPDNIVPVFKTEHAEHYIKQIGFSTEELNRKSNEEFNKEYSELTLGEKYQVLNKILLHVKNSSEVLRGIDNAFFIRILSKAFPPPSPSKRECKREMLPIVGPSMLFSPIDELGVVLLFGILHRELGFPYIIKVSASEYPDAIIVNKRGEVKRIEFEYIASNFRQHGHDPNKCDYIVCWIDDLSEGDELKSKVVSLMEFLKERGYKL